VYEAFIKNIVGLITSVNQGDGEKVAEAKKTVKK
jgi:hypothetical protein